MTRPALKTEDARDRILDAAEDAFAQHGFDGAALKGIAMAAGVAQGLIHYHYGDKARLYAAVIARRSALINDQRAEMLDAVDLAAPDALEAILRALLAPPLGPLGGGASYARNFGALAVGTQRDTALVAEHYDPTARRFIAVIDSAVPGLGAAQAAWGYSFAIGALVSVVGRTGRPERLGGAKTDESTEAVLDRLTDFTAAGIRRLAD